MWWFTGIFLFLLVLCFMVEDRQKKWIRRDGKKVGRNQYQIGNKVYYIPETDSGDEK